jgi:hypothetical protein
MSLNTFRDNVGMSDVGRVVYAESDDQDDAHAGQGVNREAPEEGIKCDKWCYRLWANVTDCQVDFKQVDMCTSVIWCVC